MSELKPKQEDLTQLRVARLRELAKEKNIKYYYKMNKETLLKALQNYVNTPSEQKVPEKKGSYIQPIKRTPLRDVKFELQQLFKKLNRTPQKTKTGFSDFFEDEQIQYQFFSSTTEEKERIKLVVTKNELIKTFEIEKNCIEMWTEIYNYLKNMIYVVSGAVIDVSDVVVNVVANVLSSSKTEENEGNILELEEIVNGEHKFVKGIIVSEEERLKCVQKERIQFLNRRMPSKSKLE